MHEARCPKCGSPNLIPDVSVFDPGRFGKGDGTLHTVVEERPTAWHFKGAAQSKLEAAVCGNCGYTELYAIEPAAFRKQSEAS